MRVKIAMLGQTTREITLEGISSTVPEVLKFAKIELRATKDGKDQVLLNGELVTDMNNTRVADGAIITVVPNLKGGR